VEGGGSVELEAQKQAWQNIVGACRLVTACEAIVVWGVNDGESWLKPGNVRQPLLFTDNLTKKEVYFTVMNALKQAAAVSGRWPVPAAAPGCG
jgi:endo-1,4-beta-xylanase